EIRTNESCSCSSIGVTKFTAPPHRLAAEAQSPRRAATRSRPTNPFLYCPETCPPMFDKPPRLHQNVLLRQRIGCFCEIAQNTVGSRDNIVHDEAHWTAPLAAIF